MGEAAYLVRLTRADAHNQVRRNPQRIKLFPKGDHSHVTRKEKNSFELQTTPGSDIVRLRHARAGHGASAIGPGPEVFRLVGAGKPRPRYQLGLQRSRAGDLKEWPEPVLHV